MRVDILFGVLLAAFLTWRIVEKIRGDRTHYGDDGTVDPRRDDDPDEDA
jgi:hypothetical protein